MRFFSIPFLILVFLTFNVLANSDSNKRESKSTNNCVDKNNTDVNVCNADFNNNGLIDNIDFEIFSTYFAEKNLKADLNTSGDLNDADIVIFMSLYINKDKKYVKKPIKHHEPAKKGDTDTNADIDRPVDISVKPDKDLLAHWLLNEGKGSRVKDKSGHGHDGVLSNAPTWDKDNLIFDGVDDFVNVGAVNVIGKALTLSAWAQADELENCELQDCRIISKATGLDNQQHYWMLSTIRKDNKTRLCFRLKANGLTTELIASSGALKNGEVFHVAGVYDGKVMRLYKNGIEVGSVVKTGKVDTSDSVDVWIGSNPDDANSRPWKGSIADVKIRQKALSKNEIMADKDNFNIKDNLFAHWSLNEGKGITSKDRSGYGHDGVLKNGATWKKNILKFDGVDDYVNTGVLNLSGQALTLAAWAQSDDLANCGANACRIISKATGVGRQQHYWMLSTIKKGDKTRLQFRLKVNGITSDLIATSGDIKDGEEFHVAAVFDGKTMRLFKNGIDVGNMARAGIIDTAHSVETWIGSNPDVANSRPWKGAIADVRIYQKVLTAGQLAIVKDSYNLPVVSVDNFSVPTTSSKIKQPKDKTVH